MTDRAPRGLFIDPARATVLVAFLTLTLVPWGQPAFGAPTIELGQREGDGDGEVSLGFEMIEVEEVQETVGAAEPSPFVWIAVPRPSLSGDATDGNQGTCRHLDWQRVPREEAEQARQQAEQEYLQLFDTMPELLGHNPTVPCDIEPADTIPPALIETQLRAVLAQQLDRPRPTLPPGFALPGLRTYLITDHDLQHDTETSLDLQIVTLDVTVTASGTSEVDWGDGTVETYDHGSADGYPDGPIDHVYTDADVVDITVTDTWTVQWEAGPLSGTFDAPLDPVVLPDVEIRERRAVRTS